MMIAEGLAAALDTSTPVLLVRAATALRWKRPDLTVTLAELALDAADDPATWVGAAGWLLHGRNLLGDGRQVACDLLEGLGRWGVAGTQLMADPRGRRLRVELAGPARRTGERAVARALLAAVPGVDALDAELQADVLAELARCAADEAPETADTALDAAEQAWLALGCAPGVASVLLVRAARDRRAGRADDAVAAAVAGLARVNASGRRAGGTESDHLAAALTAELIAALVDAGRVDEARNAAVPAATRLLGATRPSRQLAGLRLAVARVAAATDGADTVLAALEPAAQDAAEADVPELESACRSMLGELHEAAGRLDAALAAVRAAMSAERCDRDRGARLRTHLAAATATWAARPTGRAEAGYPALTAPTHTATHPAIHPAIHPATHPATHTAFDGADGNRRDHPAVGEPDEVERASAAASAPSDRAARARLRAGNWSGATGAGRRARRLAAEAAESAAGPGWAGASLPELGSPAAAEHHPAADRPASSRGTPSETNAGPDLFDDATAALRGGTAVRPAGPGTGSGTTGPGTTDPGTTDPGTTDPGTTDPGTTDPGATSTADGERPPSGRPASGTGPGTVGSAAPARATDTGRAVAVGAAPRSGSLIGDALLRELIDNARRHGASTGDSRTSAIGHDDGDGLIDARTDRWTGRHLDTEHGHSPSTNGGPAPDKWDDPPALPARTVDTGVADTVVFERDLRIDSTVAVPSVGPTRDVDAAGRPRSRRGTDHGLLQPEAATSRPLPAGSEMPSATPPRTAGRPPTASEGRRASVGADTVSVGRPTEPVQRPGADHAAGPEQNGSRVTDGRAAEGVASADAADASEFGAVRPRPGDPRRRSATDTDGLGIGDLLAGALAAYRGI